MKRLHLFEFEDFQWFPNFLRDCLTRYIIAIHKLLGSKSELAELIKKALPYAKNPIIYDLCSGAGGPMEGVYQDLKQDHPDLKLQLSDLYPNDRKMLEVNGKQDGITYKSHPVDATNFNTEKPGLRTMICSLHHMRPEVAKQILSNAQKAKEPFLAFEISDNSQPKAIWWIAIPINIIMVLFLTPMVRPFTLTQFIFTYLIPILPLVIAWDGAVSNARTYTLSDLDLLLSEIKTEGYTWEKGTIKGKAKKIYLMGIPG